MVFSWISWNAKKGIAFRIKIHQIWQIAVGKQQNKFRFPLPFSSMRNLPGGPASSLSTPKMGRHASVLKTTVI